VYLGSSFFTSASFFTSEGVGVGGLLGLEGVEVVLVVVVGVGAGVSSFFDSLISTGFSLTSTGLSAVFGWSTALGAGFSTTVLTMRTGGTDDVVVVTGGVGRVCFSSE